MQALSASPRLTNWASFRPMGACFQASAEMSVHAAGGAGRVDEGSEGAKESPNNGKMLKNE
eukprot:scaffold209414_cov19-Tisochrysis_lutea.AAC.2